MKASIITLAMLLGVACLIPSEADAQYHGVTQHRLSRRASRARGAGWNNGHGQQQGVPELDPNAAGAAMVLLLGGAVVLRRRRGAATQSAV